MNTQVRDSAIDVAIARPVDMKLEVVAIPVSDVERSKSFYSKLGWRLDADFAAGDHFRVVQFTPPGSPASIHFGKGAKSSTSLVLGSPTSAAGIPNGAAISRTPRSRTRTATAGCCRRSPRGFPDG